MTTDLTILSMAKGLAAHASTRQTLVTQNVANADTRSYRAQDLKPFAEVYENMNGPAAEQTAFLAAASRPGHAGFGEAAAQPSAAAAFQVARIGADSPNGNSVSLEDQMVRGAEAKAHHDMALGVLRKSMDLIRMSLGRV